MKLFDCTLRDGANVVGKGFDAELTKMMIEGLIRSNITTIEMGNALGLGAYEANGAVAPLTDEEYLQLIQPYLGQAEIGMFMGYKNASQKNIDLAARYNLGFLRVGANAGDGVGAIEGIKRVKAAGLRCYFSMMKGYILSPEALADEAAMLEAAGLDAITIMDSAGFMDPAMATEYIKTLTAKVKIPVGFHGHSNLGMSIANGIAAVEAGASLIDCGLLGMARSAGNCSTELVAFALEKKGYLPKDIQLYTLLDFLDEELIPAMKAYDYRTAVTPNDLIYGFAGCHSSFSKTLEAVAAEKGVHLYKLIVEVSKIDQKAPTRELMEKVADTLKQ
ncbi:MAG: 4-hydroxy-2-oxovalerate aldolase [Candidatus Heteroscillospira sp.]|jgi:4-hydroxy 2-oxovalerate aldolase